MSTVVVGVVILAPATVEISPYFCTLAPPILPNTPKPNNKPKINANKAKIPNIGHNHAGQPPFLLFLTDDPVVLSLYGVASTFDDFLYTIGCCC